ncbi:hypothetical protein BU24DRAFT_447100 [Aaosphaeria arxii CBS 175.79]|uniref:Uncharacterized protein n=1 Tax=Aaosphaeria arxii CBS 175.79 TaxID=1450172 RepID=A0A6A5Y9N3_9PLEO|nr:uncharacterized protein BU24DRAFT_447100 [Aaosphaeria arxii CBS 175.79]KAF2022292.1 hypothetical protein BU24DRAFT_447100 [Aaosphaeria arxii CBS 175.79]
MATNAPYYQLRGQFTNATNAPFSTDDDDYDLATSLAPHNTALYVDSQAADAQDNTLEESHNLVELLEAATTAADQSADAMNIDTSYTTTRPPTQNRGKRKRGASPSDDDGDAGQERGHAGQNVNGQSVAKRPRLNMPTDPQLDSTNPEQDSLGQPRTSQANNAVINEPQPANVNPAAALFRRASERTSRKYTRPPMSKLFISLQLTPENFLHLQAKAKTYMLDTSHPERQNCVGNRGKGDTDMVKLRLFNCVRDFLKEGAGEQFFGEHVEKLAEMETLEAARVLGEDKVPEEKLVWPKDATKIISLVTPLLRRMVTNERQRMYAIETRKGGSKKRENGAEEPPQNQAEALSGNAQPVVSVAYNRPHLPTPQDIVLPQQAERASPTRLEAQPHVSPPVQDRVAPTSQTPPQPGPTLDSVETEQLQDEMLPTAGSQVADLRKITIQMVKNGAKLKGYKQIELPERAPTDYHWEDLQTDLRILLREAMKTYPALRSSVLASTDDGMGPETLRGLAVAATEFQKQSHSPKGLSPSKSQPTSPLTTDGPGLSYQLITDFDQLVSEMGPRSDTATSTGNVSSHANNRSAIAAIEDHITEPGILSPTDSTRALLEGHTSAVTPQTTADDALRHDSPSRDSMQPLEPRSQPYSTTPAPPPTLPTHQQDSQLPSSLPKYTIKVMLTTGLTEIKDAETWDRAKDHVARAVWADGTMNVVVDLI